MTEEEAKDAVAKRQKTFSLELCIERYGLELGTAIFHDRQVRWQETLQSRSDIDDINRRKSNSLEMYIERCNGNEEEGLKKYEEYRKNLHGFFGASKESIVTLQPIIDILKIKNIEYKFGVNDSEFFIWDKDNKKVRFYDLFIPKHNLIIEYHGIAWHPNPSWGKDKLDSWFHPHTKETAYQRMKIDEEKKLLAEKNGYQLIEIYSDEIKEKLIEVVGLIK